MFLLFSLSVARAASSWLDGVDEAVDRALPSVTACLPAASGPAGSTASDEPILAAAELKIERTGRAELVRVEGIGPTGADSSTTAACIAGVLESTTWPAPAAASSVIVTLHLGGGHATRSARAFFAASDPSPVPRTMNPDYVALSLMKALDVRAACGDAGARSRAAPDVLRLLVAVGKDGELLLEGASGLEDDPPRRECILRATLSVRLPAGYPDTPGLDLQIGPITGTGAPTRARLRGRAPGGPVLNDPYNWLLLADRALVGNAEELAACGAVGGLGTYDVLMVAGRRSLDAVIVRPNEGASRATAACLADAVLAYPVPESQQRFVSTTRIQIMAGGKATVEHPVALRRLLNEWSSGLTHAVYTGTGADILAAVPQGAAARAVTDRSLLPVPELYDQWFIWADLPSGARALLWGTKGDAWAARRAVTDWLPPAVACASRLPSGGSLLVGLSSDGTNRGVVDPDAPAAVAACFHSALDGRLRPGTVVHGVAVIPMGEPVIATTPTPP